MREIMIYEPGDEVRYTGKELKIVLPVDGAWIAGRPQTSPTCRALVEFKFNLTTGTTGQVVPPLLGVEEPLSFCYVRFDSSLHNAVIPIAYEELEIV